MYPCREHHRLPDRNLLRSTTEISDNEHINLISSQTLAQYSFPDFVLVLESAGGVY